MTRRISIEMRDVEENGEAGQLVDQFIIGTVEDPTVAYLILLAASRMVSSSPRVIHLLHGDHDAD